MGKIRRENRTHAEGTKEDTQLTVTINTSIRKTLVPFLQYPGEIFRHKERRNIRTSRTTEALAIALIPLTSIARLINVVIRKKKKKD